MWRGGGWDPVDDVGCSRENSTSGGWVCSPYAASAAPESVLMSCKVTTTTAIAAETTGTGGMINDMFALRGAFGALGVVEFVASRLRGVGVEWSGYPGAENGREGK